MFRPTKIGEWERTNVPFCLLTGNDTPMSGFGLSPRCTTSGMRLLEPDHCLAGVVGMARHDPPEFGLMQKYAKQMRG